jgi:glycosyltransferase involved in cell wall biosynthesis
MIDRLNAAAARVVVVDTLQSRDYFVNVLGVAPDKVKVVYVGAETALFGESPTPSALGGPLRVLFYGTFIPLHGVDTIIAAAGRLQASNVAVSISLVGQGQEYGKCHRQASRLRLRNVTFGPTEVPYEALPSLIAESDVCLGVFSTGEKASRVIPHKVFQAASSGRPVVTADTPAIREVFDDSSAVLIPAGDPAALASQLEDLAARPDRRTSLGRQAAAVVRDHFGPRDIAAQFLSAVDH